MKAETRLNKILTMEDSNVKAGKLFVFCCRTLSHSPIWEEAHAEWERLWKLGYK
jgi:hypothetical protein